MNIWPTILGHIESKTAITDELGTAPTRLFPKVIPQGETTFPAGTYRSVSVITHRTFDGGGAMIFANVEFHIYAVNQSKADELTQLFKDQLEDGTGTFSGLDIKTVAYVDSGQGAWQDDIEKHTSRIELTYIMI